jgi:hypothetical protein
VKASLSELVEAILMETTVMILHITLLYVWGIVIQKQITAIFAVDLCDFLAFVPRVRRGSYKKVQHEFAIYCNCRMWK